LSNSTRLVALDHQSFGNLSGVFDDGVQAALAAGMVVRRRGVELHAHVETFNDRQDLMLTWADFLKKCRLRRRGSSKPFIMRRCAFSQLLAATSRLMFRRPAAQTRVRTADDSALGRRKEEVQQL
jgi:hypothetical protein